VVDSVVGEGVEHLHERRLYGVQVFEHGKLKAASFAASQGAGRFEASPPEMRIRTLRL